MSCHKQNTNTLFLNFWIIDENESKSSDIGAALIKEAFSLCPDLDYIVWLCPSSVRVSDYMNSTFRRVDLSSHQCSSTLLTKDLLDGVHVLTLHRSNYLPKLLVREALVEDNDDLLPILQRNNPHILNGRDDFFLADLIQNQDENNRFFVGVANNDNKVVGMLATSLDVNVTLISKIFEIDVFPNILLEKEEKLRPQPLLVALVGDIRVLPKESYIKLANSYESIFIDAEMLLPQNDGECLEGDSRETALASATLLRNHIDSLLAPTKGTSRAPLAVIICGFPRIDLEVVAIEDGIIKFDSIVEIQNVSDAADVDDDDEFLHGHLDAMEPLRGAINLRQGIEWHKAMIHDNPPLQGVSRALEEALEKRWNELLDAKRAEENEALRANAFAVAIFCIDEEFQSRADDMLRVAFQDHASYDYCMMMVPSTVEPSLLTRSMVSAKTRVGISFDQSLYIVHRDSLRAHEHLRVVRYGPSHADAFRKFVSPSSENSKTNDNDDSQQLLDLASSAIRDKDVELKDNPADVTFLAMMGDSEIVGFISLTRRNVTNDDINWLRANYEMETYVSFERHRGRAQASITQWIMIHNFSNWSRFILREIMRFYGKTLLYYQTSNDIVPSTFALDEMIPVKPRRRSQQISGQDLPLTTRPSQENLTIECPLFFIMKSLISQPKLSIKTRVVIIGGSSHSFFLLQALCFTPHLNFSNIFVVMDYPPKPMLPSNMNGDIGSSTMFSGGLSPFDVDDPSPQELLSLGLSHKVTMIVGRLTDIDRENKAVVVSDDTIVEYDVLVISSPPQDNCTRKLPTVSGVHPLTCARRGIFGIGNPRVDEAALEWARKCQNLRSNGIVVYGRSGLDAYAAVGNLLKHGIEASRIALVMEEDLELSANSISSAIVQAVKDCGVQLLLKYSLVDVTLSHSKFLQGVLLRSKRSEVSTINNATRAVFEEAKGAEENLFPFPCSTLICAASMHCDSDVFAAINDSGLVYDGGIVVDDIFCTVDPFIFAVGIYTRFSRIHKDTIPHSTFNARELGEYVAKCILRKYLDPLLTFESEPLSIDGKKSTLPIFQLPRSVSFSLPGNLHCFRSSLPTTSTSIGEVNLLQTGDLASLLSTNICVLTFDHLGLLVEMIYIGREVEDRNLACLVGWHDSYLNFAINSFEKGLVDDWIRYFREGWASVLYYDKFPEFALSVGRVLENDKGMFMIMDDVFDMASRIADDQALFFARRQLLGDKNEHVADLTKKTVEGLTVDFIRRHKSLLPRLHIPTSSTTSTISKK